MECSDPAGLAAAQLPKWQRVVAVGRKTVLVVGGCFAEGLVPGGKQAVLGCPGTPSSRGAQPRWFPRAPATPWEAVSCQGLTGLHRLSWPLWAPADRAGLRWFQSVVGLVQSSGHCVEVKSLPAWKLSSRARGPLPHAGPWAGSRWADLLYRPGPPAALERGSRSVLGLDTKGLRVVSESGHGNAPPRQRRSARRSYAAASVEDRPCGDFQVCFWRCLSRTQVSGTCVFSNRLHTRRLPLAVTFLKASGQGERRLSASASLRPGTAPEQSLSFPEGDCRKGREQN